MTYQTVRFGSPDLQTATAIQAVGPGAFGERIGTLLICGSIVCGGGLSATYIMPPPQYDKPYTGKATITYVNSAADVRDLCKRPTDPYALACSYALGRTCWIIIGPKENIEAQGLTMRLVMRHELAHCNGWTQAHEGAVAIDWHKEGMKTAKPQPVTQPAKQPESLGEAFGMMAKAMEDEGMNKLKQAFKDQASIPAR